MRLIHTKFDGIILMKPALYQDKRGTFYESWRQDGYKKLGIKEEFLQDNVSISNKHVLRGMHLRKDQGQLVSVLHGKVFDVAVDLRENSETYKQYFSIELDGADQTQLYLPPGFAHGFCVLSEMAIIHYKCTQYYEAVHEVGVRWNDPQLKINWPGKDFIVSERDQNFELL